MDDQSLRNVLGILRILKSTNGGFSAIQFIKVTVGAELSTAQTLRVAAFLVDQFEAAKIVIENSKLTEEGKAGVVEVLNTLSAHFAADRLSSSIEGAVRAAPAAISNFVILLSAAGVLENVSLPEGTDDLIKEVEDLIARFDAPSLDPVVRDIAKKHLLILSTLLRHIPIFGMEAALTTYFEFVMKLRRADAESSSAAKQKLNPLWEIIKKWRERLTIIDKAVNSGARLVENANKVGGLLEYLPDAL